MSWTQDLLTANNSFAVVIPNESLVHTENLPQVNLPLPCTAPRMRISSQALCCLSRYIFHGAVFISLLGRALGTLSLPPKAGSDVADGKQMNGFSETTTQESGQKRHATNNNANICFHDARIVGN